MSLLGSRLGNAIYDALVSAGEAVEDANARNVWVTMANEIVIEFTTNGVINTAGLADSGGDTLNNDTTIS